LEKISLPTHLHRFVHNPIDELVRILFDPLFDLLRGEIGTEIFEKRVSSEIELSFRELYRSGYEKWVALSLIKLLQADKLYQVTPRKFLSDYDRLFTGASSFEDKEEVPIPKESSCLSFKDRSTKTFIAPDFIVHLAKVDKNVAFRSEIGLAFASASNATEAREWYNLSPIEVFTSGLTLVYISDNLGEISLVADVESICRPDLIIECEGNKDWYGVEIMESIKLQYNALKPILGMYIVTCEPMPERAYKELMLEKVSQAPGAAQEPVKRKEGIQLLTVGFDESRLEPIVNILRRPLK
jgi:hypothetical protein